MQRKINESTSFAIDNMYKIMYLGVMKFKTKDLKYLGTLLIFIPNPLDAQEVWSFNQFICVCSRENKRVSNTHIQTISFYYINLYVSLLITNYLIGLASWANSIKLQYMAWSGTKREQIRHKLQWALGFLSTFDKSKVTINYI